MCSRRRKAPSVPASLQRSASASNRRFSLPENWRRLAIATTSGSRRAPSPEAISPVALPAPSATASEEEPDNPFREDFTNEVMFMSTCTLNCPRQVAHLTLARGAHAEQGWETERSEVRIGKPSGESSAAGKIPWTAAAAGHVPCGPFRDP